MEAEAEEGGASGIIIIANDDDTDDVDDAVSFLLESCVMRSSILKCSG